MESLAGKEGGKVMSPGDLCGQHNFEGKCIVVEGLHHAMIAFSANGYMITCMDAQGGSIKTIPINNITLAYKYN